MNQLPLSAIEIRDPVTTGNLTVFPLRLPQTGGPAYIASAVALEQHGLKVTEVSDSGSVPNLMVENPSAFHVLLLDGEELRGAKQNRVINTTLLLAAHSKTLIPVSCTEAGRWHYTSTTFSHSKTIMSARARSRKSRSVSENLEHGMVFMPNQGQVWDEVAELHAKAGSHSPTSAMADAFDKMRAELDAAIQAIQPGNGQNGLLAFINGKPAGFDLVSRPDVYATLHPQLIQSYAMEALVSIDPSTVDPKAAPPPAADHTAARRFLERCNTVPAKPYPSITIGCDWRFRNGSIAGSALLVDSCWVHVAFFNDEAAHDAQPPSQRHMASPSQRARFRQRDLP